MSEHMKLERGEIYESGFRLDEDLTVIDHLGGTRKVDIYLCRSSALKMQVACKILRPEFCVHFKSLEAVIKEGELLSRMDHPNVMRGHSFELEPAPRIVMDYVGGSDLKSAFFTGNFAAFPLAEALSLVRQLADGLEHVHAQGVLHLDVKPSNILYADGRAVLIDFSVAREFDIEDLPRDNAGTRDWMAPEQTNRETVGPYTDVYGLGVVMYQLLTGGELPYKTVEVADDSSSSSDESSSSSSSSGSSDSSSSGSGGSVNKVPNYDVAPVHPSDIDSSVSREVGDIALRAVSVRVEERYGTPGEFGEALGGVGG
ncbi:serine/threonine protein kinase [Candidatus Lucifugimonas marina]|uniref:Protein kinase n=1 Tax=Candidatus Lucifugimonas marina TaxID=3038979 RepID=A0AAJ5ZC15_9CHLR|nr:protein kinase [SAR202 cluster bacterium JH702]MDG0869940.1 protein kinase [SAR202 cluster bacterium JH639]WFG34664.1 protein kinase [SAR202 cluster bacterium JH545]WFG38592.1 protein kinase [SAR202 cluster bacterium JH1073]